VRLRAPLAWLGIGALVVSACARPVRPMVADDGPFTPEPGEATLWADAGREAAALRQRVRRYDDPALDAYLLGLVGAPPTGTGGPQWSLEILRDPALGAFALPDGRLVVHTGLLAAIERVEQLQLVLARQVAHVTQRHALAASRAGGLRPVSVGDPAVLGPVGRAIVGQRLALAGTAAVTGYGEAHEREADVVAVAGLRAAGCDLGRAVTVFDRLARDRDARAPFESFLLGRPAWLRERRDSIAGLIAPAPAGSPADQAELQQRLRPVVRENALEDIRLGRFALARAALERVLAADPVDGLAHVYYGDLHRLQAQGLVSGQARVAHLTQARAQYTRALALDPAVVEAHRQLGLLHYQLGDLAAARAAFERYLALVPGAPDAGRVAGYVRELSR
jgi:predicted Zn-dependent protease